MPSQADPFDPKGLIRESFRIEGITPEECRIIFLDWALSLPDSSDPAQAMAALLLRHRDAAPAHPMTALLNEGVGSGASQQAPGTRQRTGRRTGRRG